MLLLLASFVAAIGSPGAAPRTPRLAGLISTGRVSVRAVVADRCVVSQAGAACDGSAAIRPLSVHHPDGVRVQIVF